MPSNNWISCTHHNLEFPHQVYGLATSKPPYHCFQGKNKKTKKTNHFFFQTTLWWILKLLV